MAYRRHIGDGFFVSVTDGFACWNKKVLHAVQTVGAGVGETDYSWNIIDWMNGAT